MVCEIWCRVVKRYWADAGMLPWIPRSYFRETLQNQRGLGKGQTLSNRREAGMGLSADFGRRLGTYGRHGGPFWRVWPFVLVTAAPECAGTLLGMRERAQEGPMPRVILQFAESERKSAMWCGVAMWN